MGSGKSRFIALAEVVEGFGPAFAKFRTIACRIMQNLGLLDTFSYLKEMADLLEVPYQESRHGFYGVNATALDRHRWFPTTDAPEMR